MCLCVCNITSLLCVLALLICQGLRPVSRVHARLIESTTKITCPHHPELWPTKMNVLTAVSHSIQSVFNTSLTTAAAFLATAFGPLVLRRVGWDVRAWSGTDNDCERDATHSKNNTKTKHRTQINHCIHFRCRIRLTLTLTRGPNPNPDPNPPRTDDLSLLRCFCCACDCHAVRLRCSLDPCCARHLESVRTVLVSIGSTRERFGWSGV